jgi:phospholipid/cholesterol/gamma-HCH transport system substrate-binding protein
MDTKRRPSLAELKVGIFVVVACFLLAVAIFTIGTQVGLFEETFIAKTYLNNVSGLKPGDVVLLGGVEVGNVREVRISRPGELPPTDINLQNIAQAEAFNQRAQTLERELAEATASLQEMLNRQSEAVRRHGAQSAQAQAAQTQVQNQQSRIANLSEDLRDVRNALERARRGLQNIAVYMQILSDYRNWIHRDSNISLGSVGLLGDRYIEISLGRSNVPPEVVEETRPGWLTQQTVEVVLVTGTTQAGFQELITGANDILTNFQVLSDRLQDIMRRFEAGEGTVGKFFSDPTFYNNLNAAVVGARKTVDQAGDLLNEIVRGDGTIPRLIQERELYDRIQTATDRLESVMEKIESGEGTIGRMIHDPSLYQNSSQVMANVEQITRRLEEGQGTLGKLAHDDQIYLELQRSLDQINTFMADVEQGKGTLGRLAKDEELYRNMNQLSAEMIKLLYDFRQDPRRFLTIRFQLF